MSSAIAFVLNPGAAPYGAAFVTVKGVRPETELRTTIFALRS